MHATLLFIIKYSYAGIFIALGFGIIGVPVPDESLIAFSAYLSSQGKLNLLLLLPVIVTGTALGITVSYFLGRFSQSYIAHRYADNLSIDADHLQKIKMFYKKYGRFALLLGYFIPGIRHLTALFAGMNHMPYRQFAIFAYTGALLWISIFFTLGYLLGHEWHYVTRLSNHFFIPSIILVTLVLFLIFYLKQKNSRD